MSIWYRIKSQKQLDVLVKKLEKHHFANSHYGCAKEDTIALALYDGGIGDKSYTFLDEKMCSDDPYISWVNCRTEVFSEEEFIKYAKNV